MTEKKEMPKSVRDEIQQYVWAKEAGMSKDAVKDELTAVRHRLVEMPKLLSGDPDFTLKNKNVVFIGGGPGDRKSLPWGPRFAAAEEAHVVNFDINDTTEQDKKDDVYKQIHGDQGNILHILATENSFSETANDANINGIDLLEVRNVFGENPSPDLIDAIKKIDTVKTDKDVFTMIKTYENNLKHSALHLLNEGGMLISDNDYYIKKNGELTLHTD